MKVIRWVILFKAAKRQLAENSSPRRVRTMKLDGRKIGRDVIGGVQIFFFIWLMVICIGTFLVALLMPEQSFLTSFTAVIASASLSHRDEAIQLLALCTQAVSQLQFRPLVFELQLQNYKTFLQMANVSTFLLELLPKYWFFLYDIINPVLFLNSQA